MNLGIDIPFANPQLKTYIFKNDLPNSNFQKIELVFTLYIPRDCNFI